MTLPPAVTAALIAYRRAVKDTEGCPSDAALVAENAALTALVEAITAALAPGEAVRDGEVVDGWTLSRLSPDHSLAASLIVDGFTRAQVWIRSDGAALKVTGKVDPPLSVLRRLLAPTATAPVLTVGAIFGSGFEVIEYDAAPYIVRWRQMGWTERGFAIRQWEDGRWSPWERHAAVLFATDAKYPARRVSFVEADRDPSTRAPLPTEATP